MLAKPPEKPFSEKGTGLFGSYGSTFLFTLTNPLTILSFAAVFASLGLGSAYGDFGSAALLVFSVFAGSAFWWLILSVSVSLARKRVTLNVMTWVNRVSGAVILAFGVLALVSVVI